MNENINGNITGVGIVSGGTVNQTINIDSSKTEVTPQFLKDYYQHHFKTISLLSNIPKSIDDIFVNLAIIKEKKEETKDKRLNREAFLSSYEEIHKPKEPIEIKELVSKSNKSLIYGKAGIGKTTLCKYIAYKWAEGKIYQEFEYVIYIPLREWKNGGIKGAITDYYYSRDENNITIDFSSKKILFLFDGYDELNSDKKKALIDEVAYYGLNYYLITTRPYGYQKSDFRVDEYFETIGFTDRNIEDYVYYFFGEDENEELCTKGLNLENYIKDNVRIKYISAIPIMLEMICSLWERKEFDSDMTMTELYGQVIETLIKKHSANKDDKRVYKRKNRKKIQEQLAKLAFEGLTQQIIFFDGDFIENSIDDIEFFEENVIYSGFLKSDVKEKDLLDNHFEFYHLTFQEYFSALYVTGLSNEAQSKIIRDWKFYPHMQMFFTFLGGLIEDKEFLLKEIKSEPRDIVGYYELLFLSNCLNEMKDYNNEVFIDEMNKNLIEWLDRLIKFFNMDINRETELHTTIFERITNNHYFHTQCILDKLIKMMNDNMSWTIHSAIAIYFHRFTKRGFSFEEKIKPFLDKDRLLDFEKIIVYGENTYYERDFYKVYPSSYSVYKNKEEYEKGKISSIEDIQNICEEPITNDQEFKKSLFHILNRPFYPRIMREKKNSMSALRNFFEVNDDDIINIALEQIKMQNEYIDLYDGPVLLSHSISLLMSVERDDNEFIDILLKAIKDKELDNFFKEKEFGPTAKIFKYIGNKIRNDISKKLFKINNNSSDFIEELVSIIEKGYVILINSIIVESVLKDSMTIEIFERLFNYEFHGVEDNRKSFIRLSDEDIYEETDNRDMNFNRNRTFLQGIKIEVLFQAYDNGYDVSTIVLSNLILSNKPLYLKNKKLHTIENGKEISTQREVDEVKLNERIIKLCKDN